MATTLQTPFPKPTFLDSNGDPLPGAKLFSFEAGTSTPKALFTDFDGLTPLSNPAIADSAGRLEFWLATDVRYKLRLDTALDVTVWEVDNVGEGLAVGQIDAGYSIIKNKVQLTALSGDLIMTASAIVPTNAVLISAQISISTTFGTGQGLTGLSIGTASAPQRYGGGVALVGGTLTGPADYRNYVLEPTTATLDIVVAAEGGPFDGTGALILTTRHETHTADTTL